MDKMEENEIINLFFKLVRIDSPSGDESKMGKFVMDYLSDLGIKSNQDARGNIYAFMAGKGGNVLVSAHLDTVEPGRGIKPVIKGGYIISSGSTILGADNKVSVAAILYAIKKTKHIKNVELLFTVAEETDSGVKDFDFKIIKSKKGLIADRSDKLGTIVLASPFIENLYVEVQGKGAHAGLPEKAVNALTMTVNSLAKTRWGRISQKTTTNIGLISGGTAMNSVPDRIELQGEIRSFNKDELIKQRILVEKVFQNESEKLKGNISFRTSRYCNGYNYKKNDRHVLDIAGILKRLGFAINYQVAFGGSDANYFVEKGINVVNIGDGTKDPHTTKERVKIGDLGKLVEIYSEYIKA